VRAPVRTIKAPAALSPVCFVFTQTLVVVLLRRAIARAKDTTRKDYKILSIPQSVDPAKTVPPFFTPFTAVGLIWVGR